MTVLANLGTSEAALGLIRVLLKHGELGRQASNEIAQPLSN